MLRSATPRSIALSFCFICLAPKLAQAQEFPQTFDLRAGWNAIYLEVEPADNSITSVFGALLNRGQTLEEVRSYTQEASSVDFVRDPAENSLDDTAWKVFRPSGQANSLFTVRANHPYLVKLSASATFTISGRPSVRPVKWIPDSLNLRGFPVDPDAVPAPPAAVGTPPEAVPAPTDTLLAPTFEQFFASAPALTGQEVQRLEVDGQWVVVDATEHMKAGEAYWVFCKGASDFTAPLEIDPENGDGLDFGVDFAKQSLRMRNPDDSVAVLEFSDALVANSLLILQRFEPERGLFFEGLAGSRPESLKPGAEIVRTFGFRHSALAGESYESVLVIRDGRGTRRLVPIQARKRTSGGSVVEAGASTEVQDFAGLWVGDVTIDTVQEVQAGVFDARAVLRLGADQVPAATIRFVGDDNDLLFRARDGTDAEGLREVRIRADDTLAVGVAEASYTSEKGLVTIRIHRDKAEPKNSATAQAAIDAFNGLTDIAAKFEAQSPPGQGADGILFDELSGVPRSFELRLLLHQDLNGEVRLLREATQMWKDGTVIVDPETGLSTTDPDDPPRYVLVTDPTLISKFTGSTVRAGQSAGRRISSVGFDFDEGTNAAEGGTIAPGGELAFTLSLGSAHATNPYRHRKHPDHESGFELTRRIQVTLFDQAPEDEGLVDYGRSLLLGTYRETIAGLHQQDLSVSGSVELRRVAYTDRLNDSSEGE